MERYAALIGCAQNDVSTQADIAAPGCDASTATDDSGSSSAETEAAERSTEPDAEKVRLLEQLQEQGRTLAAERASHAESQAQLATIERQWQERIEAAEAAGREVTRDAARHSRVASSYHTVNGRGDWLWFATILWAEEITSPSPNPGTWSVW